MITLGRGGGVRRTYSYLKKKKKKKICEAKNSLASNKYLPHEFNKDSIKQMFVNVGSLSGKVAGCSAKSPSSKPGHYISLHEKPLM